MSTDKRFKRDYLYVRRLVLTDPDTLIAGAYLEDDSSGNLKLVNASGTAVTLSATELGYLDGLTAGTATASKLTLLDANRDFTGTSAATAIRNLRLTNLDAGISGTAGTVDIFPATAASGKIALTAADSAGDFTLTIVNASQAAARTYTIPDAGGAASFVMTAGNQTITGTKVIPDLDAGTSGTAGSVDVYPATAANGKIIISAVNSPGDFTTTITNAAQAASRVYTIPDGGANASFVLTAGNQSIGGVKTFDNAGVKIKDSDGTHGVTVSPGNETADRILSIPVLGGADTVMTLGTAQSITGVKTFGAQLVTTANVGTPETGTTAVEYGDGRNHITVLTVSTTLPAIAGGANLGVGKLLYTLPAGACIIRGANMSMAITQTQGFITADTPDGGLGSVIASGAVALLDGTPTFEDILTGQTFNDCNGTAEVKTVAGQPMVMEAGAAHTVYFNVADGWAANGDAAAILAGTVRLEWTFLG